MTDEQAFSPIDKAWKALTNKESWKIQWKKFLLYISIVIFIYLGVFLFLGLGYFFLLISLYYLLTGLILYFPPSRRILLSPFPIVNSPDLLKPLPWTSSRIIWVLMRSLLMIGLIYFGIMIILSSGFCGQNFFIC